MEFRLLGPLEVVDDVGKAVPLGGRRPRAVLAILLLSPNRAVSTDRLIDAVWGEDPPANGAARRFRCTSTRCARRSAQTGS